MSDGTGSTARSDAWRREQRYWEEQRAPLEKRQREVLWESRLAAVICVLSAIVAVVAVCTACAHR